MAFAKDLHVPDGFETDEYLLRPALESDAELDYEAVMESRVSLRLWEQSSWPEDDFKVEDNREDLAKMEKRHNEGYSFSYTVMNLDETKCLGCVYIFANDARDLADAEITPVDSSAWADCDAAVYFWVRESRVADELDARLLARLNEWFRAEWRFENHVILTSEPFKQQVQMIENAGMKLRFRVTDPEAPGRQLAYA